MNDWQEVVIEELKAINRKLERMNDKLDREVDMLDNKLDKELEPIKAHMVRVRFVTGMLAIISPATIAALATLL